MEDLFVVGDFDTVAMKASQLRKLADLNLRLLVSFDLNGCLEQNVDMPFKINLSA